MNNSNQTATPESVWAILQETSLQIKDLNKDLKETQAETSQQIKEINAETARQIKESQAGVARLLEKTIADFNIEMKRTRKMTNGVSDSYADFAEEYFFNSFENGKREFFGEKFDKVESSAKGDGPGEIDILMSNGKAVAIIEVKFRAQLKYIAEMFKKATVFRLNFPEYESHKLYLGLAAMVFDKNIEKDCLDEGIAVIKQVGDTVVISDQNLKTF
jgi:hypothetical protein